MAKHAKFRTNGTTRSIRTFEHPQPRSFASRPIVVLEASHLRKSFGSLTAVDDLTLSIPDGVCYGLLGPNGAGKTTTISMIVGDLDPDSGTVTLAGNPVTSRDPQSRRDIGYVPQELALYEEISSRDNLRFFASLYGLFDAAAVREIDRVLEIAGLTDRAGDPVRAFSGGMKRRLNIAVALLHRPKFLVLDEPTVGVDPQSRNAIFDTLTELQSEGMTILYTTHYMEEVERLCQRVAVMDRGRVMAEDTLQGLRTLLPRKNEVTLTMARRDIAIPNWDFPTQIVESGLCVEIGELTEDLPTLLSECRRRDLAVVGVRTREATLEEVFLHVTGRSLRD